MSLYSPGTLHDLAMLYLRNQDLSGKTPSEIYALYVAAIRELTNTAHNWEL